MTTVRDKKGSIATLTTWIDIEVLNALGHGYFIIWKFPAIPWTVSCGSEIRDIDK